MMLWACVVVCVFLATLGELSALAPFRRDKYIADAVAAVPAVVNTAVVPAPVKTKPIKYPYNMQKSLAFSNSYCGSNWQWLCAEFVSRSLNAGGYFKGGVTNYSNYNGVALTRVSQLVPYLLKHGCPGRL